MYEGFMWIALKTLHISHDIFHMCLHIFSWMDGTFSSGSANFTPSCLMNITRTSRTDLNTIMSAYIGGRRRYRDALFSFKGPVSDAEPRGTETLRSTGGLSIWLWPHDGVRECAHDFSDLSSFQIGQWLWNYLKFTQRSCTCEHKC